MFHHEVLRQGVTGTLLAGATLNSLPQDLVAALRAALKNAYRSNGFVCPGEVSAMALAAAASDEGLELGRDIQIVAKQTSSMFDLFRPQIDTISEDVEATGCALAEIILG